MFNFFIEYQEYIYTFLISIFLLVTINLLRNNFEIFNETPSIEYRKIHEIRVTRIGGLSLISFFISINFIEYYPSLKAFFFSCFIIFVIGFIEDISKNITYLTRFLFLITIIFFLTFYTQDFRIASLEYNNYFIIDNYIFLAIFSFFGILFCINGSNFIDGLNGLTLGSSIIIFMNYIYLSAGNSDIIFIISLTACISIVPLFAINILTGTILAGDSGSYLVGFIYGCIGILIYNSGIISAFHVACILFYPTTELVFTFFRRISAKKNPFKPDHFHLHTMLFLTFNHYLKYKGIFLQKTTVNSLTSLMILTMLIIANISFTFLISENHFLVFYFMLNVAYFLLYFLLKINFHKMITNY